MTLANALSFSRLLLIAPFLYFYLGGSYQVAALLFAVASLTDLFDGMAARLLKQRTRLGSLLDPIADKALALAALVALTFAGPLPHWLLYLSLARDGAVLVVLVSGGGRTLPIRPTFTGKLATFASSAVVLAALVLLGWGSRGVRPFGLEAHAIVSVMAVVAGCALGLAALHYLLRAARPERGGRMLRSSRSLRPGGRRR